MATTIVVLAALALTVLLIRGLRPRLTKIDEGVLRAGGHLYFFMRGGTNPWAVILDAAGETCLLPMSDVLDFVPDDGGPVSVHMRQTTIGSRHAQRKLSMWHTTPDRDGQRFRRAGAVSLVSATRATVDPGQNVHYGSVCAMRGGWVVLPPGCRWIRHERRAGWLHRGLGALGRAAARLVRGLVAHAVGEIGPLSQSRAGGLTLAATSAMVLATLGGITWLVGGGTTPAATSWLDQVAAAGRALMGVEGAWLVIGLLPLSVVAVGVLNGWRAMLGAFGAIASTSIVCAWAIPALQAGMPGWAVGVVGGTACALLALWLTYGPIAVACAAALSVGAAVACSTAIGMLIFGHAQLGGGIPLAVTLIWACGALADNAVCQASSVRELYATDPSLSWRALARSALRVGEDHQGSMLHTMGPTLLPELVHAMSVFGNAQPDGPAIALALTRLGLVTIALAIATSVTTFFAAWLLKQLPELPAGGHDHGHGHTHSHGHGHTPPHGAHRPATCLVCERV